MLSIFPPMRDFYLIKSNIYFMDGNTTKSVYYYYRAIPFIGSYGVTDILTVYSRSLSFYIVTYYIFGPILLGHTVLYSQLLLMIIFFSLYCVSRKQWPILYSNLLYEMGHYFLDIQYYPIRRILRNFFNQWGILNYNCVLNFN